MTLDKNILLELQEKHVLENIDLFFADFLLERKKSAKKDDIIGANNNIDIIFSLRLGVTCSPE